MLVRETDDGPRASNCGKISRRLRNKPVLKVSLCRLTPRKSEFLILVHCMPDVFSLARKIAHIQKNVVRVITKDFSILLLTYRDKKIFLATLLLHILYIFLFCFECKLSCLNIFWSNLFYPRTLLICIMNGCWIFYYVLHIIIFFIMHFYWDIMRTGKHIYFRVFLDYFCTWITVHRV